MISSKEKNRARKGYKTCECTCVCVAILDEVPRAALIEKVPFGQRPEGSEERTKGISGRRISIPGIDHLKY